MRVARPSGALPDPPGHLAELVQSLLRRGFAETYRDEQPGAFGSFMHVYERSPVRVRIMWDGKERTWHAAMNAVTWTDDAFGEVWVTLPPLISLPR